MNNQMVKEYDDVFGSFDTVVNYNVKMDGIHITYMYIVLAYNTPCGKKHHSILLYSDLDVYARIFYQ